MPVQERNVCVLHHKCLVEYPETLTNFWEHVKLAAINKHFFFISVSEHRIACARGSLTQHRLLLQNQIITLKPEPRS